MKYMIWLLIPFLLFACAQKSQTKSDTRTESQKAMAGLAGKSEVKKTAQDTAAAPPAAETAASGEKSAAAKASLTCKSGDDTRTLVTAAKGDGCELTYTKGGKGKVVAESASGSAQCEKVAAKIKGNLEKSGFKCD
jgi:hypothetical protein